MKILKNTKTLENLMKAFAGESQARNRYTFYSSVAGKEDLRQIQALFIETADNEKEHAKRFYKLILQGMEGELPHTVHVDATYPVAQGSTYDNLKAAAAGEREEWTQIYSDFSSVAEQEGFPEVASAFRMIAKVEERHEARYNKLASNLKEGSVFKKGAEVSWKCLNCGYVHTGAEAPDLCPACLHPKGYYELFAETY
jgi:rubrerythrin